MVHILNFQIGSVGVPGFVSQKNHSSWFQMKYHLKHLKKTQCQKQKLSKRHLSNGSVDFYEPGTQKNVIKSWLQDATSPLNFLGFAANEESWWDFWGASGLFVHLLLGSRQVDSYCWWFFEVPNDSLFGRIRPCKQWDKLPTSNWWRPDFWIINSTINWSPVDSHRFIGQQLVQVVSFLIYEVKSYPSWFMTFTTQLYFRMMKLNYFCNWIMRHKPFLPLNQTYRKFW